MAQEEIWNEIYRKGEWKKETMSLLPILSNKKVLELGVGNGKTLRAILRQNPKQVIAIDFSQEAINKCEKEIKDSRVILKKADVTDLTFSNEEFDVVVCYYILNNLVKKKSEIKIHIEA